MTASTTHLVVIPSYNTGATVYATVRAARARWTPVWVVVDGSDDGTAEGLRSLAASDPGLRVDVLGTNQGKGAAVLHALEAAAAAGFTHALAMDADGQHPADRIELFMRSSQANPQAMILGRPDLRCLGAAAARARPAHLELRGPSSRRSVPASPIRCSAFASIRSRRSSR